MKSASAPPVIAVACGGTGGHLFPGLAVAEVLQQWGCEIALMVSQKDVDQEAVKSAVDMEVVKLPAVALQNGRITQFLRGFWGSYGLCRASFARIKPRGILAMGGFTSAPPVLAGKAFGAGTFLHESNSVPGRANRWLSPWVDEVFIGFRQASHRLYNQCICPIGTPVRAQFRPSDPAPCRMSLGLTPERPVLLVMGGSQGASAINRLVSAAIPLLVAQLPQLQFLHLTGSDDYSKTQTAYAAHGARAVVRPFLTEMDLALGAATVAVNRAGASSLAEIAAMQIPSLLIPYPHATDNHQFFNASALAETGAARVLEQSTATPETLTQALVDLLKDAPAREAMRQALVQWHTPNAASNIAGRILRRLGIPKPENILTEDTFRLPESHLQPLRNWGGRKLKLEAAT